MKVARVCLTFRSYDEKMRKSNLLYAVDLDAWDGYRANRARVLDHLYNNSIDNTIILSGDSHANWVSDLARKYYYPI